MNGAESLVRSLLKSGVDTCFVNPGTSEMHFVAALDQIPGMRCVLGLFEGVVTGAADGYARMADKPAAVLLHCGPGLGNGIANLHNAYRANTPMVNIVGDQATYHAPLDPPLSSDVEGLAASVSRWVRTSQEAASVGADAAAAVQASMTGAGGVATLVLPSDTCWNPGGVVAEPLPPPPQERVDDAALGEAVGLLRSGKPTLLLAGGKSLREPALGYLQKIAAATGAKVMCPNTNKRVEHGAGRFPVARIPYQVDHAVAALKDFENIILVGTRPPLIFFAYPGKAQTPVPEKATVYSLAQPEQDAVDALERLMQLLGAATAAASPMPRETPEPAKGAVSSKAVAQSLTALLPEGCVIVDESVTFGSHLYPGTHGAAPHDWLHLTGGAIGIGIPLATGAALGAPGCRVITLQADGSAAYTLQGLWTQAREKLDVTTIVFSNRRYAILLIELENVGAGTAPGKTAREMMSLDDPAIDWVGIGRSFGVESARAETMEQFNALLAASLKAKGPRLIELRIPYPSQRVG
jgi:acetolactate synthase-1/2/3 large subunit